MQNNLYNILKITIACGISICTMDHPKLIISIKMDESMMIQKALYEVIYILYVLCFRVRLFIDALCSSAGKGLTSWLSFVMSYCKVVTFPLVSWVRCGA